MAVVMLTAAVAPAQLLAQCCEDAFYAMRTQWHAT
jgi:hypothetical protein